MSGVSKRARRQAPAIETSIVKDANGTECAKLSDAPDASVNQPQAAGYATAPEEEAEQRKAVSIAGRAWASALFDMMCWGRLAPREVSFGWGRIGVNGTIADLEEETRRRGRDAVYLHFGGSVAEGPTNVIVATVDKRGVIVHENCEIWAFSRRLSCAEILGVTRRFKADEAGRLKSRPNNLDEMRARRVAAAHARWRKLANEILEKAVSESAATAEATST